MSNGVATGIVWTFVALAAISLLIFFLKRRRFICLVDKLPGPKSHPILGFAYETIGVPREEIPTLVRSKLLVYAKEGIFRIWIGPIPFVVLVSPKYIEAVLSSYVHLDKAYVYSFTHSWLGQGLLTSTGAKWHSRRKLLTPAFHFRILDDFLPIFDEHSRILVDKLDSNKDGSNLFHLITLCTLDIICATAMGCNIDAQLNEDSEYVSAVFEATKGIFFRARCPWYYPNFIYNLSTPGKKHIHNVNILKNFTRKIIKERREQQLQINCDEQNSENMEESSFGRKRRLAFLDLLLKYSEDGRVLSDDDIQEEVDTFMFEGHDTTTAAIYWTLYFLGLNLHIQKKVHEELDSIFEHSDRHVQLDDLSKLKYLEMACKEALRIIPSVPTIARHLKEDLNVGDYVIPAGVQCLINPLITHNREEYYPNPDKFDPDRFLPENCKGRHPYAYIPFSAGPRNCIGQKFAMMEEKVVLSNILRKFEMSTEPIPEGKVPVITEVITRPSSIVKITIRQRRQ